jgi:hypothetical protein
MKPINNWNTVKAPAEFTELPAGGYVCKIMGAEVETFTSQMTGDTFEKLKVSIDISEGDYAGYYANGYRNQTEPKKWKGVIQRCTKASRGISVIIYFYEPNRSYEFLYPSAFEKNIRFVRDDIQRDTLRLLANLKHSNSDNYQIIFKLLTDGVDNDTNNYQTKESQFDLSFFCLVLKFVLNFVII